MINEIETSSVLLTINFVAFMTLQLITKISMRSGEKCNDLCNLKCRRVKSGGEGNFLERTFKNH